MQLTLPVRELSDLIKNFVTIREKTGPISPRKRSRTSLLFRRSKIERDARKTRLSPREREPECPPQISSHCRISPDNRKRNVGNPVPPPDACTTAQHLLKYRRSHPSTSPRETGEVPEALLFSAVFFLLLSVRLQLSPTASLQGEMLFWFVLISVLLHVQRALAVTPRLVRG